MWATISSKCTFQDYQFKILLCSEGSSDLDLGRSAIATLDMKIIILYITHFYHIIDAYQFVG